MVKPVYLQCTSSVPPWYIRSCSVVNLPILRHNSILPFPSPKDNKGNIPLKTNPVQKIFKKKFILRVTFSVFLHLTYIKKRGEERALIPKQGDVCDRKEQTYIEKHFAAHRTHRKAPTAPVPTVGENLLVAVNATVSIDMVRYAKPVDEGHCVVIEL